MGEFPSLGGGAGGGGVLQRGGISGNMGAPQGLRSNSAGSRGSSSNHTASQQQLQYQRYTHVVQGDNNMPTGNLMNNGNSGDVGNSPGVYLANNTGMNRKGALFRAKPEEFPALGGVGTNSNNHSRAQ